jgi:hypothetical protein
MTWDAYNRRKETLRDLLAIADRRREMNLTELLDEVDADRAVFADETELLFDLQMAWFQRLSGHLDRLVSEALETPELMAVTAWVNAAAEMPGGRALLDAHRDEPALAKAFAKEASLLAATAGVPQGHPNHHVHGRRLVDSARESAVLPEPLAVAEPQPGLIARLRSAIAA